jgi:aminoglycoside phosphotransferase (APT) family kinase protein
MWIKNVCGFPKSHPFYPFQSPLLLARELPLKDILGAWSIYRWIEGSNPTVDHIPNPTLLVSELASFITAMHKIDLKGGPASSRGVPLKEKDMKHVKQSKN